MDAIRLSAARVRAGVFLLAGLRVQGSLRFTGAGIDGSILLRDTTFTDPKRRGLVTGQAAVIGGDLSMQGLATSGGALNLRGATLRGTVNLAGATLNNPTGLTIDLHQATVAGS